MGRPRATRLARARHVGRTICIHTRTTEKRRTRTTNILYYNSIDSGENKTEQIKNE